VADEQGNTAGRLGHPPGGLGHVLEERVLGRRVETGRWLVEQDQQRFGPQHGPAHGAQAPVRPIDLVCPGPERGPIDARLAVGTGHLGDLVKRETSRPPEGDERKPLKKAVIELPAAADPTPGLDQSTLRITRLAPLRHCST
jgi:hypothetical protein